MHGYDETGAVVDEPLTDTQRRIITAMGFAVPDNWRPSMWRIGAYAEDGIPVVIRHLPYVPTVIDALKEVGFTWSPSTKDWIGDDATKAKVDVIQALEYCSCRFYTESAPQWAVDCDGRKMCPVRVGSHT